MFRSRAQGVLVVVAAFVLAVLAIPLDTITPYLDLLAPDGDLAILDKLPLWGIIWSVRGIAALVLLVWTYQRLGPRLARIRGLDNLGLDRPLCELCRETFFHWLPQGNRRETTILAIIMLVGLAVRLACIQQPMREDEAYTYLAYIRHPIQRTVNLYNLPNNHVLHSVLGRFSVLAFGHDEWAVRLPACLAGMALVPLMAATAKRMFSRNAALWAALLASLCPYLVFYSTNARGYSMVMLFTMAILCLILFPEPTWLDWLAMAVLAALGMFTVPTMLYALLSLACFAVVYRVLTKSMDGRFFIHAMMMAVVAAGLTLLLWSGILRNEGLEAITNNDYSRPLDPALARSRLWSELKLAWVHWHGYVGAVWGKLPQWIGFAVATCFCKKQRRMVWGLALSFLAVLLVPLVTHTAPPPRSWSYATPVYLMLVAAGWDRLIQWGKELSAKWGLSATPQTACLALVAVMLVGPTLKGPIGAIQLAHSTETRHYEFKRVAIDRDLWWQERDRLVVVTPYWNPVRYYLIRRGFSSSSYCGSMQYAHRLVFLVGRSGREEQLAAHQARLDEPERWEEPERIVQWQHIELWASDRREP